MSDKIAIELMKNFADCVREWGGSEAQLRDYVSMYGHINNGSLLLVYLLLLLLLLLVTADYSAWCLI